MKIPASSPNGNCKSRSEPIHTMKGQFIQMRYMQWQPNMHSTQETMKPSRMGMQHNIRQCKCLHKRDPVPTMRTCCRIPMPQRCTWQKTLCTICTIYHMYQSIGCLPCVLRNNIDQYRVVKPTNKQTKRTPHIAHCVPQFHSRVSTTGHQTLVATRFHAAPTLIAEWGTTSVARLAAPLEE